MLEWLRLSGNEHEGAHQRDRRGGRGAL